MAYAERARKAQTSVQPPVNVWSLRIEKMAAARATSSATTAPQPPPPPDDPFVVTPLESSRLRPAAPIPDPANWPEVGKAAPQGQPHPPARSDGTVSTSQSQPSTPSRKGEKTKWVPIPPEELQAAADAALKSRNQSPSHSRNRSNHPRNTNTTSSPLNIPSALPHTRSQSSRTSANPSVSHSRVQSHAGSLQSSPRVSRSRRLPGDENPSPNAVKPADAPDSTVPPPNSNPNLNYPSPALPINGVYYPPSTSAAAPPPPSFHPSAPAFYPQGTLNVNGSSPPFHQLSPPPPMGSPLSPSSPSTHPYAYPMPMYGPYEYPSPFTHGLNHYAPWHGHEYPPPLPRHPLSGQHSPIYPPPHFALHGQGHNTPPQPISHSQSTASVNGIAIAPALLNPSASTSSSTGIRERTMVFGSINLDSQSPDPLSVPLPLSSVPSGSSAASGINGEENAEKTIIGKTLTFSIGVDTSDRALGSVPARLRSRTKGSMSSEGVNGKDEEESSSPRKTRTSGTAEGVASVGEAKKWKFGTTSVEGVNTPSGDRDVPLPNVEAGPSGLGGVVTPAAIQLQHSATMPDISAGGPPGLLGPRGSASFVLPRHPLPFTSNSVLEVDSSSVSASAVLHPPSSSSSGLEVDPAARHPPPPPSSSGSILEVDPSLAPALPPREGAEREPADDSDLEVKDYGYGFGNASGSGYATVQDKEERVARQQRQQREREWEMERIRREREMLPPGWVDDASVYSQSQHRSPYEPVHGEEALAGEMEGLSLGPDTAEESEGITGPVLAEEYPHQRGGPQEGIPPHPGRGRRGYGRGYGGSERGYPAERGERGRRGRGANGFGGRGYGGAGGRGYNPRGGPQQRPGPPPPFSVTPPPPHFQPLPLLPPHEQQQHYYPPPRQQHQAAHYLPPNGYDTYSGGPPPPPHGVPAPPPHHHLPIPPPLPPALAGALPGLGGAPLPPPQSTIPFPLDPTRYWLLGQLEYYLSPQNMAQDFFLRQRMDARGWIPIPLIASFNRVKLLTHDTQLVRDVLALSQQVQVRGSMVRMGGWERFVLPDAHPSTVEEQPLPLMYQAQNMGYWEEGGQAQGGFGGEGYHQHQQQIGPDGQPAWHEQPASAQEEGSNTQGGQVQQSAESAVNGYGHGTTSQGASSHAEAHDINGYGGATINGVHKHASEEEFEDEEEEEDVVFVMGDEAAGGGSWSPDRRS